MIFIGKEEIYFSNSKASVIFLEKEYKTRNKAEEELLKEQEKKGLVFLKKEAEAILPKKTKSRTKNK